MAKLPEPEPEAGAPLWMATYGDMVTLVLTFFVLLFSFSNMDAAKWQTLVQGFAGGPAMVIMAMDPDLVQAEVREGAPPTTRPTLIEGDEELNPTPAPTPKGMQAEGDETASLSEESFQELMSQIAEYIDTNGLAASLEATRNGDMILIRFRDNILFDSGKAVIKPEGLLMLDNMYELLMAALPAIDRVRIEGHTDNVPINNALYADNWDLSTARSGSVRRYFISKGMDPAKLAQSGMADTAPVDTNETAEGRANNRRVDLVIERKTSKSPDTTLGVRGGDSENADDAEQ